MINPYVVHNLDSNWPNASLFDPERWNSEDSGNPSILIIILF